MPIVFRSLGILGLLLVSCTAATAQSLQFGQADYERARLDMLSDIANPEKAFLFAQTAVAVGDVRGAIDALERVLTLNPDLTNIRFELGLLYLRAGSPELAEGYLRDVIEAPDTPSAIRERSADLLQDIETQSARHFISGRIAFGVRHDSNANRAPDRVLVSGIPFDVSAADQSTSDFSAVVSASLQHRYDFGGQFGPFLETEATVFSQNYQDVTTSDIFFLGIESGPRFRFGIDGQNALRPYVGISTLYLGQEHYGNAVTLGAEYVYAASPRSAVRLNVSSRWQDLVNSDTNPTAARFEGRQLSGQLGYRHAVSERTTADISISFTDSDLDAPFESNLLTGLEVALSHSVENWFNPTLDAGIVTFSAGYAQADFDAPNPVISPNRIQKDDRWRLGITAAVPVSDKWIFDAGVNYARNDSNLPNDDYDNLQVSIGLRHIFRRSR